MIYSDNTVTAKNGSVVPLFKNGKPSASKYNPDAEQIFFESEPEGCVVVAGIAGGFHIEKILNKENVSLVIAVEADNESLEFCRQFPAVKKLEECKKVVMCENKTLKKILCTRYFPALYKNLTLVFNRAWKNENAETAQETASIVKDSAEQILFDYSTQAHFGKIWNRNILLNLKFISDHFEAKNFFAFPVSSSETKKTAAIIAAGPTLDNSIEEIRNGNFFIVSTDTAFGTLVKHGIIPNAVISIDSQHISSEHFLCGQNKSDTAFIFDLSANPEFARHAFQSGKRIQFCPGRHPLSSLATKELGIPEINSGAGTVTIAAADWAKNCGFSKLKFFGADFSYYRGKAYAKGTYLESQFMSNSSRLFPLEEKYCALMFRTELEKIPEKKEAYTSDVLKKYKASLQEWAEANCFSIKDGIYISDRKVPQQPLQKKFIYSEFISSFLDEMKTLMENPEPDIILQSNTGRAILPVLAFFKNSTLFERLKLAYKQALRYNYTL
ncbi:6-hydroxymethylpterin diphosphokinase MptE-like protein [Treponema sp.]|uniref:6-hydroxymethylpterin diphosphokinase MptE-like protein n=1 Tax=Treponema sp. TaxID=166 RepID=UPI003F01EF72